MIHTTRETARRGEQTEAQLKAEVEEECGRLAQITLYPSLMIWTNHVGVYVPKTDAFAAVDQVFTALDHPDRVDVKRALARRLRTIGDDGSPDLFGVVERILFGIELKRPAWIDDGGRFHHGGDLQPNQVDWHRIEWERRRLPVAVIDDPAEVEPFLRRVLEGAGPEPSPGRGRW